MSADSDAENTLQRLGAGPTLPAAAVRALAEAAARRAARKPEVPPKEVNGRDGLDPVRYGDWEVKGLASDF